MPDPTPDAARPEDATPEKSPVSTFDVIEEALRKQAARRPEGSPPREMPVTPTLPRQPKPYRNRKRRQRE